MPSPRQTRDAIALLNATGAASASVIGSRLLAFSHPGAFTPWHQAEAQRMTSEKMQAAGEGLLAAWTEMFLLPWRMMQLGGRPAAWTPGGGAQAWMDMLGLWTGVGNAALRPARDTVVRNRARLARSRH